MTDIQNYFHNYLKISPIPNNEYLLLKSMKIASPVVELDVFIDRISAMDFLLNTCSPFISYLKRLYCMLGGNILT